MISVYRSGLDPEGPDILLVHTRSESLDLEAHSKCYPLAMTIDMFTIRQVAAETGISVHTLRYYEQLGLIHPIDRADNTHRRYTRDDIGWIQFLLKLRATGMSLQHAGVCAAAAPASCALPQRIAMLKTLQLEVEEHVRELNGRLDLIRYKIEYYSGVVAARPRPRCWSRSASDRRRAL